jgi:site-specific DNA-methyltransferase (adenine-specific)
MNEGLMSSITDEWATPQDLFDRLDDEFSFTLDVCADDWNFKCPTYFTKDIDGLSQPWTGVVWMNPPYGRTIRLWMAKALQEAGGGRRWFV